MSDRELSQISIGTLINSNSDRELSQNSVSVLFQNLPIYLSGSITGSSNIDGNLGFNIYISGSISGSSNTVGNLNLFNNLNGNITGSSNLSGLLINSGAIEIFKNMIYSTAF